MVYIMWYTVLYLVSVRIQEYHVEKEAESNVPKEEKAGDQSPYLQEGEQLMIDRHSFIAQPRSQASTES